MEKEETDIAVVGTDWFAPPEIHLKESHDKKVDIWGCAVLLFCIYNKDGSFFTGDSSFDPESLQKIVAVDINSSEPQPLPVARSLIRKLLLRNPEDRPYAVEILEDEYLRP